MNAKKPFNDDEAADESEPENVTDEQVDAVSPADARPKVEAAKVDVPVKADAPRKPDAPKVEAKPQPQSPPPAKPKPKVEAGPGSTAASAKPGEPRSMAEIMKFDLKVRRPRR